MCIPIHEFYLGDEVKASVPLSSVSGDEVPVGAAGRVENLVGWLPPEQGSQFVQTVRFGHLQVEATDHELVPV